MNILVLNCGSSSLKFQIIETDLDTIEQDGDRRLASGLVERLGGQSLITVKAEGQPALKEAMPLRDHRDAIDYILRWIVSERSQIPGIASLSDLHAVGHRVVHGGERFVKSVIIDAAVMSGIEDCIDLAPLHNPANLKGIRAARDILGAGIPQVAVFDTAFHSTMPERAFLYGIPYQLYRRHKIRRYGFHGTSHRYVSYRFRRIKGYEREETNCITVHLGNGASACAIKNGDSVDTSMGFTPLEGLLMGTRCGDVDASVVEFLAHKEGMSVHEVDTLLNKQSGLLGLSGLTQDMRDLEAEEEENADRRARLAIDVFCYRVRKYIGAYFAQLGGTDALIFTGGIGENSHVVRRRVCENLECLGLDFDDEKNRALKRGAEGLISREGSRLECWVLPTNEELLIARDTVRAVKDAPRRW